MSKLSDGDFESKMAAYDAAVQALSEEVEIVPDFVRFDERMRAVFAIAASRTLGVFPNILETLDYDLVKRLGSLVSDGFIMFYILGYMHCQNAQKHFETKDGKVDAYTKAGSDILAQLKSNPLDKESL